MATKLYVGNLPFNTTENELQELFSQAGAVQEVMLMQDKFTGKSRGFAFVTMGSDQDAQKAIAEINGKTLEGRALTVNEARPREPRPPGGGGGGNGGRGGRRRPAAKKAVGRIVKPAPARRRPKKTTRGKAAKRKPAKSRKRSTSKRTKAKPRRRSTSRAKKRRRR